MEDIIEGFFYAVKLIIRFIVWLIWETLEFFIDFFIEVIYEKIPKKYRWLFWLVMLMVLADIIYFTFKT